ncbi:MAG: hypothetical protein U0S48_19640 [Solirubrobacteraceae bacterium]
MSDGDGAEPTILIGFGDAPSTVEAVRSLVDAGHRVVVFGRAGPRSRPHVPPLGVRIIRITAPERDAGRALADLVSVARAVRPAVVLPLDDVAVWLAGTAAGDLEAVVAGPTGPLLDLALDHRVQLAGAELVGLAVPPTVTCRTRDDLLALAGAPLLVRSALAVHERDGRLVVPPVRVGAGRPALAAIAEGWDEDVPLLAQSHVAGRVEEIAGVASAEGLGLWSAHRPSRVVAARRSGRGGGWSPVAPDAAAMAGCEALLGGAHWRGPFSLEFVRDAAGRLWFSRLAGRCTHRLALARRHGFEHPAAAVAEVLGASAARLASR